MRGMLKVGTFKETKSSVIKSLVITSDPQYPWTPKMDEPGGSNESEDEKKRISEKLIIEQYNDINSYISSNGPSPVLINGDITAYGHSWQRKKMKELCKKIVVKHFYGLGNHDIENNLNDCYQNQCTRGSFESYVYHVENMPEEYLDEMDIIRQGHPSFAVYHGSFAYSLNFGDIYSIQLNNYPTMKVDVYGGQVKEYAMYSTLDWLEKVLQKASKLEKIIIINVHKPNDWKGGPSEKFKELLKKYDVKAVFCGHYHKKVGLYDSYRDYFGDIPVFLSGSASQRTYLTLEWTEQDFLIYSVKNNDWKKRKLEKRIELTRDASRRDHGIYKIERKPALGMLSPFLSSFKGERGIFARRSTQAQNWSFEYDTSKNAYQISTIYNSNLVMTLEDNTSEVIMQKNEKKNTQYWSLKNVEDGFYLIQSKQNPNLVFTQYNGNNVNLKVMEEMSPPTRHQKFRFMYVPVYEIETLLNDRLVLDFNNGDKRIIIAERNNSLKQKWLMFDVVTGLRYMFYSLENPEFHVAYDFYGGTYKVYLKNKGYIENEWYREDIEKNIFTFRTNPSSGSPHMEVDITANKVKIGDPYPINSKDSLAQKFKLNELTNNILGSESSNERNKLIQCNSKRNNLVAKE